MVLAVVVLGVLALMAIGILVSTTHEYRSHRRRLLERFGPAPTTVDFESGPRPRDRASRRT